MRDYFFFLLKYLFAWILFFILQRIIFLSGCLSALHGVDLSEQLLSFLFGFSYDISAACYIAALPLLFTTVHAAGWVKTFRKFTIFYDTLVISVASFITSADIGMFQAWGTKLNHRAISYFVYPKEVFQTISTTPHAIWLLILVAIQILAGTILFQKIIPKNIFVKNKVLLTLLLPCFAFLLIIGIRGGTQTIPFNKSRAYYSKHTILNLAAMNSGWNLLFDLIHRSENQNQFVYFPTDEAIKIKSSLFQNENDSLTRIFSLTRPNIVIIQLESWSADVIEKLGGETNVTPFFNTLCKQGLLFTNFYASGYRTEHGLISIISGLPAQPRTSIIRDFGKFEKLPSIAKPLDSAGYTMTAYYGANLEFANTGPFLYSTGFKKVFGENDFTYSGRTVWGAYDEDMLHFVASDSKNNKEPFLNYIITITSHDPFDEVPGKPVIEGNDISAKYRNSVHYTDHALQLFFEKIKTELWYKNTVFILLADHSTYYSKNHTFSETGRFHIPMVWYGEALKTEFRGTLFEKYCSQFDLPSSLLSQLDLPVNQFTWSKNIFQKSVPAFSYFSFENGFGFINKNGFVIYDNDAKKLLNSSPGTDEVQKKILTDNGKAIVQLVQEEFLKY